MISAAIRVASHFVMGRRRAIGVSGVVVAGGVVGGAWVVREVPGNMAFGVVRVAVVGTVVRVVVDAVGCYVLRITGAVRVVRIVWALGFARAVTVDWVVKAAIAF